MKDPEHLEPRRCASCTFVNKVGNIAGKDWYHCRRHAPTAATRTESAKSTLILEASWPMVKKNDWCGEYNHGTEPA